MGQCNSCLARCCPCMAERDRVTSIYNKGLEEEDCNDSSVDVTVKEALSPVPARSDYLAKDHFAKSAADVLNRPSPLKKKVTVDRVVRVVLTGESATGKTCLLRRYLNNYYDDSEESTDYFRTLGVDFGCKTVEVQGARVRLQLWDTGGEKKYAPVVSHYLHGADGVVLTYDVTRRSSFEALESRWLPFLKEHRPKPVCMMLVGTKTDLLAKGETETEEDGGAFDQEVDTVEAQNWADQLGIPFYEVSSKDASNVDLALLALIRMVINEQAAASANETANGGDEIALWTTIFAKEKTIAVTSTPTSTSTSTSTVTLTASDDDSTQSSSSTATTILTKQPIVVMAAPAAAALVAPSAATTLSKKKKRLLPISVPRPGSEGGDGSGTVQRRNGYAPLNAHEDSEESHDSDDALPKRASAVANNRANDRERVSAARRIASHTSSLGGRRNSGGRTSDVTDSFRAKVEAVVQQLKVVVPASDDESGGESLTSSSYDRRRPLSPIA